MSDIIIFQPSFYELGMLNVIAKMLVFCILCSQLFRLVGCIGRLVCAEDP